VFELTLLIVDRLIITCEIFILTVEKSRDLSVEDCREDKVERFDVFLLEEFLSCNFGINPKSFSSARPSLLQGALARSGVTELVQVSQFFA